MRISRLLLIITKRYLKKPFTWLILLIIPALCVFIKLNKDAINSHEITVGFNIGDTEDEDSRELNNLLTDKLSNSTSLYKFVEYNDLDKMVNDVQSTSIECGYYIPGDMFVRLINDEKEDLINVYISPSTTMNPIINETLYSYIFNILETERLKIYLSDRSIIKDKFEDNTYNTADVSRIYNEIFAGDKPFHFDLSGNPTEYSITTKSIILSPLRGLLAILIILSGFTGALEFYKDQENPIFHKQRIRLIYILVPSILTFISSFISLSILSMHSFSISEFGNLLIYTLASIAFVYLLSLIIKRPVFFASLIPIFIIGCLIFTPVFINIGEFIPTLKPISYAFLPYYYLMLY